MKIRHKILLTTLSTLILSGPVVLGLVSALVIKNPDTPTPPKPIAQEYKKIGNYQAEVTESDEFPAVYILKSKESTDENVLRFMEIKTGIGLQNTYGCAGWTVFGKKIETGNWSDSSYNLAIDENTIPQTILVDNVEKPIVNICGFGGNTIDSITVPNFIETIGYETFTSCYDLINLDLTKATNLTTIESFAFSGCTGLIGTLTIPASVTTIDSNAFSGPHFTSISVDSANPKYALASSKSVGTANVVIDKTLTPDLNYDYSYHPIGGLVCGELTINNDPKITVLDRIFVNNTGITSVVVQENITEINGCFTDCANLFKLDVSKAINLSKFGWFNESRDGSFCNCSNLSGTLVIPEILSIIQTGNPYKYTFNQSAFSSLIFKAATPSNDINYETIFQATIAQSLDKYTITVPHGSKTFYQAKFSSVPDINIVEA